MAASATRHPYPFDRAVPTAIPPLYEELRETERVAAITMATGDPGFLVTRYEDVRFVLSDPRFSVRQDLPGAPRLTEMTFESVMTTDPPVHTRLRRLLSRDFTARRIERMRPRLEEIAEGLLDEMEKKGAPADIVESLAVPFPITVICELLGVPMVDVARFRGWADTMVSLTGYSMEDWTAARDALESYLDGLVAAKRENPGADLLSALVATAAEDNELTDHDVRSLSLILLLAGYEPASNQLGSSVLTLLRFPDRLAELRRDPGLLPSAVEELMRYAPAGDGALFRVTLEDVTIGDTHIPANSAVLASTQAANWDPRRFDDPTGLRLDRPDNQHTALGHGIHFCLGAALARVELQVAIGALLRRFPRLALATDESGLRWSSPGSMLSGFAEIPVTW
ncbi:cytochrome P450 [Streptomyces daghestanicus]|uniref:Cytochrome P450 n=1 Tax=Streptomyces daghestanicus TaxID=66885 RepID=A0ABQ3QCG0_9ACTN|nr:cytochrome P450 [Streptomyces daghestanicus]GGU55984.1 cytochrome P450 [Streptomyces daghestanicus]GHI34976.1 cytochrome P450 [Streptomyces daghestanicus]